MTRLFVVLGAVAPRVALLAVWFGTPLVFRAFAGGIGPFFGPLLGLLVAPYTALSFVLIAGPSGPTPLWGWVVVLVGLVIDWRSSVALGAYLERVLRFVAADPASEHEP